MSRVRREAPPEPGSIRPFDFPDVDRRRLDDGLELCVARTGTLPVVSAQLFMRAGEAALGLDRAGLAVLAGDAMEGGTGRRSGTELAGALEDIGARLSVTTGWEGTTVALSCLADRLPTGLELLAEAVLDPSFPEDEVARVRDQQLASLRRRAIDPAALAADAFTARVFAPGIPYARPQIGRVGSVEGVGREAVRGYADACWRPVGGGLVVVGDVEPGEVAALAERVLGSWAGAPAVEQDFDVGDRYEAPRVWVVDRPGAVQSELRVGHVGTRRTDPRVVDLTVLNAVLGGSFTSRLNLNLRETHGFTYGVRSRFGFRSRPGPFLVSTAVGTEVTAAALREIAGELDRLRDGGPTEDETRAATDYLAGVFPLRLQTAAQVGGRILETVVYDLPDDDFRTWRDRIRAVTAASAGEAGRLHLRPEARQTVVVGDARAVVPEIEALDLGPVEVVPPAGAGGAAP